MCQAGIRTHLIDFAFEFSQALRNLCLRENEPCHFVSLQSARGTSNCLRRLANYRHSADHVILSQAGNLTAQGRVIPSQIHLLILKPLMASVGLGRFLITSKASDARRQGATTEVYEPIRRKEERALARLWREGNAADDDPAKAGLMP